MAQVKVEIKGVHPKGTSFSKVRHLSSNSNKGAIAVASQIFEEINL